MIVRIVCMCTYYPVHGQGPGPSPMYWPGAMITDASTSLRNFFLPGTQDGGPAPSFPQSNRANLFSLRLALLDVI
jgi:hypothetical protein